MDKVISYHTGLIERLEQDLKAVKTQDAQEAIMRLINESNIIIEQAKET